MILDIHTHHAAPQPLAVVSAQALPQFQPEPNQLYSVGVHPWYPDSGVLSICRKLCMLPQVVAVGESGIDLTKDVPLYRQVEIFTEMIRISEDVCKPLIIHDVRAHDIILSLHTELRPAQSWVIHGFRYKPTVAGMFTRRGIYLSFGEKFNPDTLRDIPPHLLLAETDESPSGIHEIIEHLSLKAGRDLTTLIAYNAARLLQAGSINRALPNSF